MDHEMNRAYVFRYVNLSQTSNRQLVKKHSKIGFFSEKITKPAKIIFVGKRWTGVALRFSQISPSCKLKNKHLHMDALINNPSRISYDQLGHETLNL